MLNMSRLFSHSTHCLCMLLVGFWHITIFLPAFLAFLAGLFFFVRLTSQNADKKKVNLWPLLMLLAFPTSFFFHTVYTEGLFFLFFTSSLYYTKERKYFYAAVLAALASSTRLIGVLLVIPLAIMLWHNTHIHKKIFSVHYLILLIPFLGIGTYMIYLWRTTGDPLFFFNSQPAFGANRSTQLILLPQVYFRYFKIFFFAHHDIAYRVALVECLSFTTVVLMSLIELVRQAKKQNHFLLSVGLVSLVNILLPTLTGTFSSIPRYALFSFSVYFFLASLTKSLRIGVILTLFLLQCILFGFFLQGYFIG